jgi:predicted dehydrogenase
MLQDDAIDTIYVASPNSFHFEQTKQILEAKKNAIVEKPFTSHDRESEILIELADKNGCFLFEAMSIHDMPNLSILKEKMKLIEPIKWVELSMAQYSSKFSAFKAGELPNVFNPAYSGGALMDLNIYHLNFILDCFGKPESMKYDPQLHTNGIDTSGLLIMNYPNCKVTSIATKDSFGRPYGVFHGEKGMIEFTDGINGLRSFTLWQGREKEVINVQVETNRLIYEVQAFERIISTKNLAEMKERLAVTHKVMVYLTQLRKEAGLIFNADLN